MLFTLTYVHNGVAWDLDNFKFYITWFLLDLCLIGTLKPDCVYTILNLLYFLPQGAQSGRSGIILLIPTTFQ